METAVYCVVVSKKRENRLVRKPHILLLYRELIPSVRLCGHNQLEYLSGKGLLEYREGRVYTVSRKTLQWADTVILGRLDNAYELALTRRLKSAGKQLLYVLDDDLLNVPLECSSSAYYGQPEIQNCIREMILLSDGLISPSPLLAQKYSRLGQKQLWIEEPAIEPVPFASHNDSVIRIGFAGSVDRTGDLQLILETALRRLHIEYGDRLQFAFYGSIPDFAEELNAISVPYQNSYIAYRRELNRQTWDIGLAPMPDTPFHACKHYNKYSEYAAAGIMGVFSNVPPYTRIAQKYSGAILCDNTPESWYMQLKALIDDPQRREALRLKASENANGPLAVSAVAEEFYRAAKETLMYQSEKDGRMTGIGWIRLKGYFSRVRNLWMKYGFGIFSAAFRKLRGH